MKSLHEIAHMEAVNCGQGLAEIAPQSMAICGGFAGRGSPTSWVNRAEGLGFAGPLSANDISQLMKWFEDGERQPLIKTCLYAHSTLFDNLARAGFCVKSFEQVFFHRLAELSVPNDPLNRDIEIRLIDKGNIEAIREVTLAIVRGFAPPGKDIREDDLDMTTRCGLRERAFTFGAFCGGRCVGGGGMDCAGELAQLYGVAVLESHRRMGIQQALMAARLKLAHDLKLEVASISSSPNESTERNARRLGFEVLYSKVVMWRPHQRSSDC